MEIDPITSQSTNTVGKSSSVNPDKKRLEKACKQFEAIFLGYLLKSMRKTVDHSDLFGSRKQEAIWQEMLDQEIADSIASTQSNGLADMLYRQLSSHLDKSTPTAHTRGKEQ